MNRFLENLALQCLHSLPAETAHNLSLSSLRWAARTRIITTPSHDKAAYSFGPLTFSNRLGLAAGFDKNGDAIDALAACGFGYIELGTVTPRAQPGNRQPRLFRLPSHQAIINRMGFNNKGVDYLVARIGASSSTIIKGVNIGKNKDTPLDAAVDDYLYCLNAAYPVADYIVINISSPNTPDLRKLQFGQRLVTLLTTISRRRDQLAGTSQRHTPILLKIAPDIATDDLHQLIHIVNDCALDGLVATNTTMNRDAVRDSPLAQESGGLSGMPLQKLSLDIVQQARSSLAADRLLIGVGGIGSAQDAAAFHRAGADLIQIYTGFVYQGNQLIRTITTTS